MIAYIPARLASTRFPEKVLCLIGGEPMIAKVAKEAARCDYFQEVVVLCDDVKIKRAIEKYADYTKIRCVSGTTGESGSDRVFKYRKEYGQSGPFTVLQGDCPDLNSQLLNNYIASVFNSPLVGIHTIVCPMDITDAIKDQNVKVVMANNGKALYFSRAQIPYMAAKFYKHAGIYTFNEPFLKANPTFEADVYKIKPHMALSEDLEQIGWLANGYDIYCFKVEKYLRSIDTPHDYMQFSSVSG